MQESQPFPDDSSGAGDIAALLAHAQSGNTAAREQLINRSQADLHGAATRLIGQRSLSNLDTAVAVQTVLETARRDFGQFTGQTPAQFAAWLERLLEDVVATAENAVARSERPRPSTADTSTMLDSIETGQHESLELQHLGRFEIIRPLGAGGMGRVYLAYDPSLRRQVALKVPHPGLLTQQTTREQFIREARAAGMLRHPNIVLVYESGEIDGVCFIASQFCEGPTLAQWLERRVEPVPVRTAARIIAALAKAMQHAHDRGILHRDVKPGNILLDPVADQSSSLPVIDADFPFFPRITDFGLAHIEEDGKSLFQSGVAFGTAAYMAPEQAQGERHLLGPRTDVYALGGLLYELLTGKAAFQKKTIAATLAAVQMGEPIPPRRLRHDIPKDLEAICLKAMGRSREDRYPACGQLADDLDRFLLGHPIAARPVGLPRRILKWAGRRPALATLAAFAHLVFFVGIAAIVWHNYRLGAALDKSQRLEQRAKEAEARSRYKQRELELELYASDMSFAHRAWQNGDVRYATRLLSAYLPKGLAGINDRSAESPAAAVSVGLSSEPINRMPDLRGWEWYWLWNNVQANPLETIVSNGPCYYVTYSPDGQRIAVCGQDSTVRFFDADSLKRIGAIETNQGEANSVAFAARGNRIATAGDDGTACVWDLVSGRRLVKADITGTKVFGVLWADNDRKLITCGDDPVLRVWDARTGALLHELVGHSRAVEAIAISPDGVTLASASSDGKVGIWNIAKGMPVRMLSGGIHRLTCVAFSVDGRILAAGAVDGTAHIWSTGSFRLRESRHFLDGVQCLAFSRDASWLTVGTRSGSLHHWGPLLDGKTAPEDPSNPPAEELFWQAHAKRIYGIAYSPGDQYLVSVGQDGRLRRWTPRHRSPAVRSGDLARLTPFAMVRVPGRSQLLTVNPDELGIVDRATGTYRRLAGVPDHRLLNLAISKQGGHIAAGGDHDRVYFGSLERGLDEPPCPVPGHVHRLVFTNDGRTVIANIQGKQLLFLDRKSRAVVRTESLSDCLCLALSPSGRWLVAGDEDDLVVWDLEAAEKDPPIRIPAHDSTVRALAFSTDGRRLASAGNDRRIRTWIWPRQEPHQTLEGSQSAVACLAFSLDGETLFSSGRNAPLNVWHVATGRFLFALSDRPTYHLVVGPGFGQLAGRTWGQGLWLLDFEKTGDQ